MDNVKWDALRERMRILDYPVNCTYDPETLQPTGISIGRINRVARDAPELFNPEYSMIDVGCNKGMFSFYVQSRKKLIGVEYNEKMVTICNDIRDAHFLHNMSFIHARFEEIPESLSADIVHFGQCAHYLFRDAFRAGRHPLSFLDKAKVLSVRYIAVDGAFDGDSSVEFDNTTDGWPADVKALATVEGYASRLRPEFKLIRYGWSGASPTRYMALFERI